MGNELAANTFLNICGSVFWGNKLGVGSYANIFGNDCNSNTFGDSCGSNTFGGACGGNTFGYNCDSNTFGDDCNNNVFGNTCIGNTFGYNCSSNTFGKFNADNNLIGNLYCCRFRDECDQVTIEGLDTGLHGVIVGSAVHSISVPTAQLSTSGIYELVTYSQPNSSYKEATLIHKTGYNTETAVSTTDGGVTWTAVQ